MANDLISLIKMSFAAVLPSQLNMLGHETYMAHFFKTQALFLNMMLRDNFGIPAADGELFELYAPGCGIRTLQFALQHRCSWGCHPACCYGSNSQCTKFVLCVAHHTMHCIPRYVQ